MNEEEKKAIEILKDNIGILEGKLTIKYTNYNTVKAYNTILNFIEKLQKENQDITQQRDYYKARYNELSKIVDSMTKHIYILGDYACLYEECDDNMDRECEDCIKEYFYKKVKETKDNGSTKKL
ncbi:MAG: hypothetical protein U0M00_01755 [Clostridia bacterium]|nr:hypothetical protein [Clostridia bacterium]